VSNKQTLEQLCKFSHYADSRVAKLRQSWNDRLEWPPSKIPERYLGNDLAVALELKCDLAGTHFRVCALVGVNRHALRDRNLTRTSRANDKQLTVFIRNVEVVEHEKKCVRRIGSVIGLKTFNPVNRFGICDSLYFSLKQSDFIFLDRLFPANRKLDPSRMVVSILNTRKLPYQMIKTGAKVVNDFTSKNSKSWRNSASSVILQCLQQSLSVVLWNNGVSATLNKSSKLPIKIADVLVGPF
jgi:hypothetical protein